MRRLMAGMLAVTMCVTLLAGAEEAGAKVVKPKLSKKKLNPAQLNVRDRILKGL